MKIRDGKVLVCADCGSPEIRGVQCAEDDSVDCCKDCGATENIEEITVEEFDRRNEVARADARLIAAAPELLATCEYIEARLVETGDKYLRDAIPEILEKLYLVIKKAKGDPLAPELLEALKDLHSDDIHDEGELPEYACQTCQLIAKAEGRE